MSDDTPPTDPNQDLLTLFLRQNDARCPLCRYDLKGITAPNCPECGSTLLLTLKPAKPRNALWITGLAGFAAGVGTPIVFLGFMLITVGRYGWDAGMTAYLVAFAIQTLVFSGLLAQWCAAARKIRLLPIASRLPLVLIAWVAAIATPLLIIGVIDG